MTPAAPGRHALSKPTALPANDRVAYADRAQQVANRELATIEAIEASGRLRVRRDTGRRVTFTADAYPHLDYGYAVTSHSSQGQTADRVLVHVDTEQSETLVNRRLAYVAVSRGRYDAQIYTNDTAQLGDALSRDVSHRSAMESTRARESSTHQLDPSQSGSQTAQLVIAR
jgi:ATP-dependent exoDNAse (exonuclease V) alpha subunit